MTRPYGSYRVNVDWVWRNRGVFSLQNFFVISMKKSCYSMRIMPVGFMPQYLPAIAKEFEENGTVKYAQGDISPMKIVFYERPISGPDMLDILRDAFLRRRPDQQLECFLKAQVYVLDEPLNCTIESLLPNCSTRLAH